MIQFNRLICVTILVSMFVVPFSGIYAQTSERPGNIPQLGGHSWAPNTQIVSPFIRTQIRNTTGFGQAPAVEVPAIEIGGEEVQVNTGDMIFINVQFDYQHAVKNWLAFVAIIDVSTRIGKKKEGLLTQGITSITGFKIGWLIKLLQSRRVMLSTLLTLSNSEARFINIIDYIYDIVEGGWDADAKLTKKFKSMRASGGLSAAWTISPMFGLYTYGQTGYGESVDRRNKNQWGYKLSAVLDTDLSVKTRIPLHIGLGLDLNSFPETGDDLSSDITTTMLRFGYLDDDFSLGLELYTSWIPLKEFNETFTLSTVLINLRHYF